MMFLFGDSKINGGVDRSKNKRQLTQKFAGLEAQHICTVSLQTTSDGKQAIRVKNPKFVIPGPTRMGFERSSEDWKALGNAAFVGGYYIGAHECYTLALERFLIETDNEGMTVAFA